MSGSRSQARTAVGALLMCAVALPLLSGCTLWNRTFHRGRSAANCTEKPFTGNTASAPPLKVPEGLSAPDTRNAVKIPDLGPQAREMPKLQPCLALPPNFFAKAPAPANRATHPGAAPATPVSPAPAPATTPAPPPAAPPAPAGGEPVYPPGT
ncbi:MAG TPA: hypothetical protein VGF89_13970 [Steroidobacteraceae bacterium]